MTITDDAVREAAYAKINLSLHVTGQRADGYHLLESMVMFTQAGDVISARPAKDLSLSIEGPFAKGLSAGDDNLVLRAARLFGSNKGAAITLTKNLPVASGIGGGSADAAATVRALSTLWECSRPDDGAILALGADVPVCMSAELTLMQGIGEQTKRLGPAPILDMVLVNPRVGVATSDVFGGLASKTNPPMDTPMPDPFDTEAWIEWLGQQRNDLEPPAKAAAPIIGVVLSELKSKAGCKLARMSGSGATCFAIFEDADLRDMAAEALRSAHPDWWVSPTQEASI